ncbi:MAG TPA: ABC transporter ATP-binding protein, partial [Moraxellaceae bacterium]
VILLAQANLGLGLFLGGWASVFLTLSWTLARRGHRYAFAAATARSATTGNVVDSVTNIANTRLFARLDYEREHLEGYLGREREAMTRSISYSEKVRWIQFSAAAFLKAGLLWYALVLWGQGRIGAGEFVMAVSMSLLIINEVRNLSRRFLELFEAIGNVSNGVQTLVRSHEVRDIATASALPITAGHIRFDDVSFSYDKGKPVFRHLSVDIPGGQRVGLVGFSGSGKSTFVNSLLRLHDVDSGVISIDGHDIRDFQQDSLHAQISLIPQDPGLFHRSLRENIGYGRLEATDAEIIEAAKAAHAHDFITQMKEGYDSLVGERGVKLSGGQRQRIAIARVVLKDAPILILDEATSSLDSVTEKAIQETLDTVMKGKTVLVVAHRLSTIAHLDRILVFENGRIIEDGSHAELLARQGAYHRLWSRQSDGFLPDAPDDASPGTSGSSKPHAA